MQHVAQQPDHVDGARDRLRFAGRLRMHVSVVRAATVAHEKPGPTPRIQIAVRDQPFVRLDHGKARHAFIHGELADRRHPHAGAKHPFINTAPSPLNQLVDKRKLRRAVRGGNLVERNGHAGLHRMNACGDCTEKYRIDCTVTVTVLADTF